MSALDTRPTHTLHGPSDDEPYPWDMPLFSDLSTHDALHGMTDGAPQRPSIRTVLKEHARNLLHETLYLYGVMLLCALVAYWVGGSLKAAALPLMAGPFVILAALAVMVDDYRNDTRGQD